MSIYTLDTEFIDTGHTIYLVSVGVVDVDTGEEFYREVHSSEVPWSLASTWVNENVRTKLLGGSCVATKPHIARDLMLFIDGTDPAGVTVWADTPAYDWVTVSQLYGPLVHRPHGWPLGAFDLRQWAFHLGVPRDEWPTQPPGREHNALHDARWDRDLYRFLEARAGQ